LAGSITNEAALVSDVLDFNLDDNQASLVSLVNLVDDLVVTQTASPSPVLVNNSLLYAITVTNRGFAPVSDLKLMDVLPGGVSFISILPSQGQCTNDNGTILCDLGALDRESSATSQLLSFNGP
jgi:uncharacterized repeat protein (TIGR01451 family)